MKISLEVSESFLGELKKDMAAGVLASFFTREISSETKLSICVCNAVVNGKQEITRHGEVLVSARLEEL